MNSPGKESAVRAIREALRANPTVTNEELARTLPFRMTTIERYVGALRKKMGIPTPPRPSDIPYRQREMLRRIVREIATLAQCIVVDIDP